MGQLSTRSVEETYAKGDGKHSFGGCFVPQKHSGDCPKEVCHPALVGEGLWPQTGKVSPACTQGEKHRAVFMVIPPYSGSPVTARKPSFLYPTDALALIMGSSTCHTSSIDLREKTCWLVHGPGPRLPGWPICKCPLHPPQHARAAQMHSAMWCHPERLQRCSHKLLLCFLHPL